MPKAQLRDVHAHPPQALASRFKGPWSHDYETAYRRLQARGQLLRPDAAGRAQPAESRRSVAVPQLATPASCLGR